MAMAMLNHFCTTALLVCVSSSLFVVEVVRCQTCVNVPKSCVDWYEAGYYKRGNYMIDPDGKDGVEPFVVECQFDVSFGKAVTTIHHDSETRIRVLPKCQNPECYKRPIHYTLSLEQVIAVINTSSNCHQTFKYDCYHSVLSSGNTNYAAWYDRNNKPNYYWDGSGDVSDHICACGASGTCDSSKVKCSCDANDLVWRQDTGALTSRKQLPVTLLAHGDADGVEDAYHTLGPVVCEDSV